MYQQTIYQLNLYDKKNLRMKHSIQGLQVRKLPTNKGQLGTQATGYIVEGWLHNSYIVFYRNRNAGYLAKHLDELIYN